MASKIVEEFLKKASPETQAALQQTQQDLHRNGVQNDQDKQPKTPEVQPNTQEMGSRSDVQTINQEWQQDKDVKIEQVSEKSDLMLADKNLPSNDPAKSGAYDPPKFMDEQGKSTQQPVPGEKADLQQTRQDLQRDGIQVSNQNQEPKRQNAVDQALAAPSQPKSPEPQKSPDLQQER